MDSFYLGAYWGSRRETALQCGERLAACIARLSEIDGALGSWFRRGASKVAAKTPVGSDAASLEQLLAKGVNRRDVDGEVLEELGFSVGLWNRATPAVGLSGTMGAHPSFQGVLNSVVFDFPPPEADALRLYKPIVAEAIFDAVVETWEPSWATWTSHALRNAQGAPPREPVLGWLTYVAAPITLELPGVTMRALHGGTAIRIGSDVAGTGEGSVVAARSQLVRAGVLHPIP